MRRESEERYRKLAEAMPQIVWTADRDGRATTTTAAGSSTRASWSTPARTAGRSPSTPRTSRAWSRGAQRRSRPARSSRTSTASAPPTAPTAGISAVPSRSETTAARSTTGSGRRRTSTTEADRGGAEIPRSRRASARQLARLPRDARGGRAVRRARVSRTGAPSTSSSDGRLLQVALEHVDPQKVVFAGAPAALSADEQSARRGGRSAPASRSS